MGKKVVLIICDTHLKSDPRVYKQILALKDYFYVITMGLSPSELEDEFIYFDTTYSNIPQKSFLKRISDNIRFKLNPLKVGLLTSPEFVFNLSNLNKIKNTPDVIIANELPSLPYAIEFSKKRIPVHFDAHEYYLNDMMDNIRKEGAIKRLKFIYNYYIPKANSFSTVCESIAENYKKEFKKNFYVLENVPKYFDLKVKTVNKNDIKLIHHGVALPDRKIEIMIQIASKLPDNYFTTFALVKSPKYSDYYDRLRLLAATHKNIRITDGFSMQEIPIHLNDFDLGIYYLEETNLNNKFSLPNKFFEFIQGRLAVITTPNIEMKRYIEKYKVGIAINDFNPDEMLKQILALNIDDIMEFKKNSDVASQKLCFENAYKSFAVLVKDLS